MFNAFLKAARLRTLPLSLSGIILGSFLAAEEGAFQWSICILAMFTTVGFQVLSNFANDYGDGVKGTDNHERVGPQRGLQSGIISPKQMLTAIKWTAAITFCIALGLLYLAFGKTHWNYFLLFVGLGILCIAAAIKYTMGHNPYGYNGFGDVFVFLFFGWLAVVGSYFLYTKTFNWWLLMPATSIGMLSAGVLNLNNLRDRKSDASAGKNTLVVKIGEEFAKYYHYYLLIGAFFSALLYGGARPGKWTDFIFVIAFIPIFLHVRTVYQNKDAELLDPELKKLALSTFLFAILFGIGRIL
ncbi:1,4-dihydroxy-2-naphthoate polyprenyltransferase [Flavobacteriaceae bacterium F08102]|nr:1,4-dihydroxy-2-naphthoate polyprenyltransferase [Flavobacteriaceae bacterium F08102]